MADLLDPQKPDTLQPDILADENFMQQEDKPKDIFPDQNPQFGIVKQDPKVASFINEAYDKSNQWLAKTLDNVDAIPVPKDTIDKKAMREMAASYAVIKQLTGVEPVEAAKNYQLLQKGVSAQWGEDAPKSTADFLDQARRHINGTLNYGTALTNAFNQGITDNEGGKMKDPVISEQEWRTSNGSLIASKGGSTPLDEKGIHEAFTSMYDRGAAIAMNPMFPLVKQTYDFFKGGVTPEGTPKLDAVSDTMLEFDATPSASESTLKSKIMGMTDEQQNQFFQTLGQYSLAKGDDKASIGQWFGELGQTLSRGIVDTGNAIVEPPLRSLATSAGDLGVLLGNPELAQGAENYTRDLDVQARLKDAADNVINPLHEYGFATDVIRGAVSAVPWMAAFAVDPAIGIGAMGLSNIGNVQTVLRQNNPGMSQAELNAISVMAAAPMTALQSISMGSAFKAFPWLEQRIATTFGGGIVNQIAHIGVTTAGMNLADATSIVSQKLAQVFDPEIKMGSPASDQLVDLMLRLPESASTFALITLAGAGIHKLQGGKNADQAKNAAVNVAKGLRDEQALRALGWSNEQILEAQNAPLDKVLDTVTRIKGDIRSDAIAQGKTIAEKQSILSRLYAESPETPTMIVLDDGSYRLMVPDSKGVLQSAGETPDFEVANSRLIRLEKFHELKQLQHFNQLIDHMMGVWEKQGIKNRTVETPSEPGKTVQDYLDQKESTLSEAELRLRVALAGGHENDSLSSSIIEGYTTNEWKNKVYTDIIKVLDHNPQTFLHESSDAHTNRAIAMGKFTHADLVRWIRQTEAGMKAIDGQDHQYLKPEYENNPAAIVEAHTQLFLDYAGGKFEAYKAAPSALKGFFKAMLRYFQNVLAKAKVLNAAIEAGTVPKEYHQHLAETMGLDMGERLAPEEGKETARLMGADVSDGNLEQQTLFSIKPKESADDEKMNPIRAALQQYEDGEKIQDFGDLVDHIDELAGETGNSDLDTALYDYRTAVDEDYKMYGGRGDAEEYEAQFLSDLAKAADNLDNESNGEPITHPDGTVSNPNETTEPGTPAPDTGIAEIDPDQQEGDGWKDIPWTEETNFSIKHLPTSFVWMSKKEYDKIAKRTDTIAGIHIDRMRVGEYLGIDLQGGMYYPTIVENLKKRVVWAFNSAGVARTVARRAAENGGYVKLILMQEGNVIGNKTFGNIWFEQLRRNIAAGSITEKKALEALNTIRDRYKTKKAIVDGTGDFVVKMVKDKETGKMVPEMVENKKTGKMEKKMVRVKGTGEVYDKSYTGHMEEWKSLAEAQTAILAMTQTKRASTYFNKTKTNTKSKGEGISYGNLLSKKMTAMGLPDAATIVEAIEEPSFKGVPKGASVAIIKFDPVADGEKILTGKQAGVTPHISYNYVLKGEPVARMRKFKVVDEEFPETKNRILTQAHTDFPLERSVSFSIKPGASDILKKYEGMNSVETTKEGRKFSPIVRDLLQRRKNGEDIPYSVIQEATNEHYPAQLVEVPKSVDDLPSQETIKDAVGAKYQSPDDNLPKAGDAVEARQDVPSMTRKGVGVVTLTSGDKRTYLAAVRMDKPQFVLDEAASLRIGLGQNKAPHIKIHATFAKDQSMPPDLETWTQVGYNPDRHSYYYDRSDMRQVVGASEAYQVGNTVFVKDPVYGDGRPSNISYSIRTKADAERVNAEFERQMVASPTKRREIIERAAARFGKVQEDMAKINEELASDMKHRREVNAATMQEKKAREIEDIELGEKQELRDALEKNKDKFSDRLLTAEGQKKISLEAQMKDRARLIEKGIKDKYAEKKKAMEQRYSEEDVTALSRADIRQEMQQNLVTLGAIIRTLPKSLQGEIGSPYTQYAALTNDTAKAKFLSTIIGRMTKAIDNNIKGAFIEKIEAALKKAKPKAGDNKIKKSRFGADAQDFLDTAYRASLMDNDKVVEELDALEKKINDATTPEETSALVQEWGIVNTYGDLYGRTALHLENAYKELMETMQNGREAWRMQEQERIDDIKENQGLIEDNLPAWTDAALKRANADRKGFWDIVRGMVWSHTGYEALFRRILPKGMEPLVQEWSNRIRRANNETEKASMENWTGLIKSIQKGAGGDGAFKTAEAVEKLRTMVTDKIFKIEGRRVQDEGILIEKAEQMLKGEMSTAGYSKEELNAIADELASLPVDTRKKYVTITRVVKEGTRQALPMSLDEMIFTTMAWEQLDVRAKMEYTGWTDESYNQMVAEINKSPIASSVRDYLKDFYKNSYDKLNEVHMRMFGMRMADNPNYAPTKYETKGSTPDPTMDGIAGTGGGTTPGFLKPRVKHSEPFRVASATDVYQQNAAQQAHWVAFAELYREISSTLNGKDVRLALKGANGMGLTELLNSSLKTLAQGGGVNNDPMWVKKVGSVATSGTAVAAMGYNLKTIANQLESGSRFLYALPLKDVARALSNPVALLESMPKVWNSETVQNRLVGGSNPAARFVFQNAHMSPSKWLSSYYALGTTGLQPMQYADAALTTLSSAIVYRDAYTRAMKAGLSEKAAEARALDAMDAAVYRYSQPVMFSAKSDVENTSNAAMKLLFMFMSDPRLKTGIITDAVHGIVSGKGDKGDHWRRIGAVMLGALLSQTVANVYRDIFSDDSDDKIWTVGGYAKALALAPFQGFFLLGTAIDVGLSSVSGQPSYQNSSNPLVTSGENAIRAAKHAGDILQTDNMDKWMDELNRIARALAVTPVTAVPAAVLNVAKPIRGAMKNAQKSD